MHELRKVPFFIALIWAVACLGLELGSSFLLAPSSGSLDIAAFVNREMNDLSDDEKEEAIAEANNLKSDASTPPGRAVPAMAYLDGLLVFTLILIALPLVIPAGVHSKLQGIATLIVSILILIAAISTIFSSLIEGLIMLILLISPPFGTIAYMVVYGFFNVPGAVQVTSATLIFRLIAAILLIVAQQKFLRVRSLVILILTCFLAGWIVQFLLTFPPSFLASITDALGAIIVGLIAAIWAIVLIVFSIISIIKAFVSLSSEAADAVG